MNERFRIVFGPLAGAGFRQDFRPGPRQAEADGPGAPAFSVPALLGETQTERIRFYKDGSLLYEFPSEVMIDPTQEIRMIETDLVHQEQVVATVLEKSSPGDYQLTIRGLLVGRQGEAPAEELEKLRRFFQRGLSCEVTGDYLAALGITNIVLKRISYVFPEGFPDTVGFSIEARSDKAVELLL